MQNIGVLTSQRLTIRPVKYSDVSFVYQLRNEKSNMVYLEIEPYKNMEEAAVFVRARIKENKTKENYFWIVEDRVTKELLGSVCLWAFSLDKKRAEIGYHFLLKHQGHKYAIESSQTIVNFGFDSLNLSQIEGITNATNAASIAVLKHCGFRYAGFAKDLYEDIVSDIMVVYRITK